MEMFNMSEYIETYRKAETVDVPGIGCIDYVERVVPSVPWRPRFVLAINNTEWKLRRRVYPMSSPVVFYFIKIYERHEKITIGYKIKKAFADFWWFGLVLDCDEGRAQYYYCY